MLFITESCNILLHFPLELIIAIFESILSTFTNSTPNSLPVLQIFYVCPNPLDSLAIFLATSPLEPSTLFQPGLGGCATGLLHSCHVIDLSASLRWCFPSLGAGRAWPHRPVLTITQQKTPGAPCALSRRQLSPPTTVASLDSELHLFHSGETRRLCLGFSSAHWGLGTPGSELKQFTGFHSFCFPASGTTVLHCQKATVFTHFAQCFSCCRGEGKSGPCYSILAKSITYIFSFK